MFYTASLSVCLRTRLRAWGLLLLLTTPLAAAAQNGFMQNTRDRIESLRVAFITRELQLTPEESQKFWPVYNEYLRETDNANRDQMLLRAEARIKGGQMSDAEIEQLLDQMLQMEKRDVEIQEKYLERFKQVLPIRKVALLYPAERNFRRELISKIRGGG